MVVKTLGVGGCFENVPGVKLKIAELSEIRLWSHCWIDRAAACGQDRHEL
jgi:hypothetical protein